MPLSYFQRVVLFAVSATMALEGVCDRSSWGWV